MCSCLIVKWRICFRGGFFFYQKISGFFFNGVFSEADQVNRWFNQGSTNHFEHPEVSQEIPLAPILQHHTHGLTHCSTCQQIQQVVMVTDPLQYLNLFPKVELVCFTHWLWNKFYFQSESKDPRLRSQTESRYVQTVPDGKCLCPDFRAFMFRHLCVHQTFRAFMSRLSCVSRPCKFERTTPHRAFIWVWTYRLSVWDLNLGCHHLTNQSLMLSDQ